MRSAMNTILAEGDSSMNLWVVIPTAVVLLLLFVITIIFFQFLGIYVRAWFNGARVSLVDLIGMKLRRFDTNLIVAARIQAVGAGLDIPLREMQTHYQARGDLMRVINAMIAAHKPNIELPW